MEELHVANVAAYLGAAVAMGFGAIGSGWGIGYVGVGAARGMARQPSKNSALFRSMLIGQAVASNPSIFALVISFLLYSYGGNDKLQAADSFAQAAAYLGAGISIGLGAIGSGAGNGLVAADAVEGMARNPKESGPVTIMMIVGQAMGQTPVLFSLVVSFMLLFTGEHGNLNASEEFVTSAKLLSMGICMGFGAIGPGLSSSYVGGKFCEGLAKAPEAASELRSAYFIGGGVAQCMSIFAFVFTMILWTA